MPREKLGLKDILPLIQMFGPQAQAETELTQARTKDIGTRGQMDAESEAVRRKLLEAQANATGIQATSQQKMTEDQLLTAALGRQAAQAGLDFDRQANPVRLEGMQLQNRGAAQSQEQARNMSVAQLAQLAMQTAGMGQQLSQDREMQPLRVEQAQLGNQAARGQIDRMQQMTPLELAQLAETTAGLRQQNQQSAELQPFRVGAADLANQGAQQQLDIRSQLAPHQLRAAGAEADVAESNARYSDDIARTKIDQALAQTGYINSETAGNKALEALKSVQSLAALRAQLTGPDGRLIPGADEYMRVWQLNQPALAEAALAGDAARKKQLPAQYAAQAAAGKDFQPEQIAQAQRDGMTLPQVNKKDPLDNANWLYLVHPALGSSVKGFGQGVRALRTGNVQDEVPPLRRLIEYLGNNIIK